MAGLFDSAVGNTIGSTPTLLYTAGVDGVAMSLLLTNTHYGALPVSVWLDRGGQRIDVFADRIKSGGSAQGIRGDKIATKVGDKIYAQCPVAGVVDYAFSAYKDT